MVLSSTWGLGGVPIALERVVDREQRQAEYLAKAAEAEKEAAEAKSPDMRESWLKIAQGYRDLAAKTNRPFKL